MRFKCSTCDEWHSGIPGWGWRNPFAYSQVPEDEREHRCFLTEDLCVVDDKIFLITGLLEIPVIESEDLASLRVWVSVNKEEWFEYQGLIGQSMREHFGPYVGRLDSTIPTYPDTFDLPVSLVIRNDGVRPLVKITQVDHPLCAEQGSGMELLRVARLYDFFEHGNADA